MRFVTVSLTVIFVMAFSFLGHSDELDGLVDSDLTFATKRNRVLSTVNFFFLKGTAEKKKASYSNVYAGDEFYIKVTNSPTGYVYVFYVDTNNKLYPFYRSKDSEVEYSSDQSSFDRSKGKETFYVIVSEAPLAGLSKIFSSLSEDGESISSRRKEYNTILKYHKAAKKRIIRKRPDGTLVFKDIMSVKVQFNHK
ncbi:MAG: DUF4384 domain-containing protein [Spirochaetota bacterium]|nr:DUF4384 domain-containing protein [Spirochaetota bacterium]